MRTTISQRNQWLIFNRCRGAEPPSSVKGIPSVHKFFRRDMSVSKGNNTRLRGGTRVSERQKGETCRHAIYLMGLANSEVPYNLEDAWIY
jgi:hypothetical protein